MFFVCLFIKNIVFPIFIFCLISSHFVIFLMQFP